METTIVAPRDGVVEAVHATPGAPFERDAVLVSFVPGGSPPPGPLPQGEGETAP
jgi:hypothetical protein